MKARNYTIYDTEENLKQLFLEYKAIGRDVKLEMGKLTVFALPRKKEKNERKTSGKHHSKSHRG